MKLFAVVALFLSLVSISDSMAKEIKLVKVEELGPLKHKVIYQSSNVKSVKGSNDVRGVLVARWGLYVYEVVDGHYSCNDKLVCKLTNYKRIATFESCEVKAKKVKCSKRLSGDSNTSGYDRDVSVSEDPDAVYNEYDNQRGGYDSYPEFPIRVTDEYSDLF